MIRFQNNPIHPHLSSVLSTWTETEKCFEQTHLVALSKHLKRSNLAHFFFNYMQRLKSAIFARAGMAVPAGPQKRIIAFEKFFLFWVPMNI